MSKQSAVKNILTFTFLTLTEEREGPAGSVVRRARLGLVTGEMESSEEELGGHTESTTWLVSNNVKVASLSPVFLS